eukprot:682381-Rhodomonas_salina.1
MQSRFKLFYNALHGCRVPWLRYRPLWVRRRYRWGATIVVVVLVVLAIGSFLYRLEYVALFLGEA